MCGFSRFVKYKTALSCIFNLLFLHLHSKTVIYEAKRALFCIHFFIKNKPLARAKYEEKITFYSKNYFFSFCGVL